MKYFEVIYTNWHGDKLKAIVATINNSPETPTAYYNFGWNGNKLISYCETTFAEYRQNR